MFGAVGWGWALAATLGVVWALIFLYVFWSSKAIYARDAAVQAVINASEIVGLLVVVLALAGFLMWVWS